mmetsp:Transcript_4772/g.13845  ORF Transcript_4772/g.13845 Transcript_4772/m.13845 type:complete len:212 (+) Transcript_4772:591-1226(+)
MTPLCVQRRHNTGVTSEDTIGVAGEGLETRHSELRRRSRLLPRTRAPLPALPRCVCASSNTENEMWPGETDKAGELGASAACSFQVRSSILHLRLRCIRYKLHHYRRCPLSIVRATTRGLKASLSSAADIRAQPAASPRSRSRCWTPGAGERHVGVGAVVTLAGPRWCHFRGPTDVLLTRSEMKDRVPRANGKCSHVAVTDCAHCPARGAV